MVPQGCQIARSQATRLSCQQEIPGDAQGVGHDTIQFGGLGGVVVRQVARHGRLGQGSCSDNVDRHRHLWGTAVTLQVRDWSTYSNPNNQSKKHCDSRATHWVQFGGSGREHWSQDGIALDVQFSMWVPTAKCRISQTQCATNFYKMPQTHIQTSFWHFVDRNGWVRGHLEYAACIHLS